MEQQNDEAPCYASVCARLETATPGTSDGKVNYVHAVYQDVAAVASGLHISIIDVGTASVIAVLGGVHSANIFQIAWAPDNGGYGTSESSGQRLASVDQSAKAVVWDVATATPLTVCSVVPDRRKQPQQPAVVDMAWGSSARDALLVLVQPATLVIINAHNGVIARTLSIAQGQVVTSLLVDEWDPYVFATTTMSNSLLTCRIDDPQTPQGHQPVVPFANSQVETSLHNLPIQGNGVLKVRWVPNRSILLLLQPYQLLVYDIDSKAVLSRADLTQRYAPFVRWLGAEGSGACLGTGDDGGCNTLMCEHEGGFVSVWHDANGSLNYTMHAFHRLMPHFRSEALGLQASLVALVPTLPRFSLEGSPSDTPLLTAPPLMWISAIMSNGQVWRWRVPLPVAQTAIYRVDTAAVEARKAAAQLDLIKLSSTEVIEGDSRAFIAHSRSLSRRSLRSRENSYTQLPAMGREPSLAASDASGSLMSGAGSLPPRRFLVDGRRSGRERDSDGGDGGAMPRNTSVPMMTSPSGMLGPQRSLSTTPELVEEGSVASPRPASGGRPSSGGLPPLPPAPSVPAPSAEPAALEVMSSALTAAASSISVFPCLVPRGDVPVLSRLNARANPGELPADVLEGGPMEDSAELLHIDGEGSGTECVSLVAIGTTDGAVEVATVAQGALQPLAFSSISSFKIGTSKILSVVWMGSTLRFASMTCTAQGKVENQKYSYVVAITDVVSSRTVSLLREEEAVEPLVALRACPHGRYLAVMPRAGGLQVWCVPIMGKAVKVRTVELPFVAMAWVHTTPHDGGMSTVFSADMEAAAWPAHYKRVSSGRSSGSKGAKEDTGPTIQAAFCFAVSDGRLGSITVTDRGVKKRPVTAPHWTVTYVDRLVVTSIAAIGDLVFIGDSDGILYQWNTATGKTMVVPAGLKVIRKIALGPPGSAALDPRHGAPPDLARLVLLYGDGSLGVWQVTDELGLEGGRCESIGRSKLARYTDAAWVPLPAPLTGGCVCAAIGKNSGAVLIDMVDRAAGPPDVGERHALLGKLVRGERVERGMRAAPAGRDSQLVRGQRTLLAPPRACHSLRLLPSAVITFLRLILESGVPLATLQNMGSSDEDVSTKAAQSLCCALMDVPEDGEEAEAFTATLGATGRLPQIDPEPGATLKLATPDTFDPQAVLQAVDLNALSALVARVAMRRTGDPMALLLPHEVPAYSAAVATKRTRERRCKCMAFAAALFGCRAETRFWAHLHGTLSTHSSRDSAAAAPAPPGGSAASTLYPRAAGASESQQRVRWHEQAPSDLPQDWVDVGPNPLQDRRVLEYVSIGEYASAAALMMGENPSVNNTFYRNAVMMIALAGGSNGPPSRRGTGDSGPFSGKGLADTAGGGRGFQVQALKVVAEHARDIGDRVLCVTLLCAAGRWVEAVAELQAMDDWRSALALAEHALSEPERNALLHAWAKAQHAQHVRPDVVWCTAGLYTAAGSLRSAAAALRGSGLSAAASAYARICSEMGLVCSVGSGSSLEGVLPAAMRSKIAQAISRSRADTGGLFGANGAVCLGRGTPALGWVTRDGRWCKEGKGPSGRDGLDPEEMVLVNFDAPDTVMEDGVRKMSGETIVDEDRVGYMLSDQRQHVLFVLMEVCKGDVW